MQSLTININMAFHMLYVYFVFVSYTFTGSTLHVSINSGHSRQSERTASSFINNIAYRFEGCELFPDGSGIFLIPTRYCTKWVFESLTPYRKDKRSWLTESKFYGNIFIVANQCFVHLSMTGVGPCCRRQYITIHKSMDYAFAFLIKFTDLKMGYRHIT